MTLHDIRVIKKYAKKLIYLGIYLFKKSDSACELSNPRGHIYMASGPNHMRGEHKSGNAASSIHLLPPDETRASLSLSLACERARAGGDERRCVVQEREIDQKSM
jgi:hypothetical protein